MHILYVYIYITHTYLLFSTRQIATIRMEIDRGVKAAVDFFFPRRRCLYERV